MSREDPDGPPAQATGADSRRSAFWRGLTRPSLPALGITLLVASTLLAVSAQLVLSLTPESMASGLSNYIAAGPLLDERCLINGEGLALYYGKVATPDVVVYGTSSLRQVLGSGARLAEFMTEGVGSEVTVRNFCAGGISFWEVEAQVAHLPDDFVGIVVLSVNPANFCRSVDALRFVVTANLWAWPQEVLENAAREQGVALPEHTGNYFLDHRRFFVLRFRNVLYNGMIGRFPPVERAFLQPGATRSRPEAAWRHSALVVRERLQAYDERFDLNRAVLERIVKTLNQRPGVRVALVESPHNPVYVEKYMGAEFHARHVANIAAFSERQGVAFIDLNREVGYVAEDFVDVCHVWSTATRVRSQRVLSEALVRIFKDRSEERRSP